MIDKKLTALLGSLLLLAAAMPLALAHQTAPSQTSDDLTPLSLNDDWRRGSTGTSLVSGNYVGNIGAYLVSSVAFPELEDNAISFAFMFCDLEVLGDGSDHDPLDESTVDGDSGNDPTAPGLVADGTWDDGGIGGACHTRDQYSHGSYNTPGCSGTAYGEDAVSGARVWLGVACDYATHGSGPGLSTCVVNEVISEPTTGGLTACVATFLAGGAVGGFTACGDDSSADDVNYGEGGGNIAGHAGVAFPTPGLGCTQSDASAAIFVFDYANLDTPDAVAATAGWVDTV